MHQIFFKLMHVEKFQTEICPKNIFYRQQQTINSMIAIFTFTKHDMTLLCKVELGRVQTGGTM